MLAEVAAALGEPAVVLSAHLPVADTVAAIEAADADMVLVLVGAEVPALDRAMVLAAIGPLAVTRAPVRVCALEIGNAAAVADVVAAARFLAGAESTTGQALVVA